MLNILSRRALSAGRLAALGAAPGLSPQAAIAEVGDGGATCWSRNPRDRGTLQAGRLADIVVLNGDPLANVSSLLDAAMVITGEIVVDKR
jgi:imidazolonepropionase-like amidohydrolase